MTSLVTSGWTHFNLIVQRRLITYFIVVFFNFGGHYWWLCWKVYVILSKSTITRAEKKQKASNQSLGLLSASDTKCSFLFCQPEHYQIQIKHKRRQQVWTVTTLLLECWGIRLDLPQTAIYSGPLHRGTYLCLPAPPNKYVFPWKTLFSGNPC